MRVIIKHINKESEIKECTGFHKLKSGWTILKDGAILNEYTHDEVSNIEEISELPFGKVISKPKR